MARQLDNIEDLRGGIEEIEDLRKEEKKEGLGEVTKDADDGESHASKVAISIADEDAGGKPEVAEKELNKLGEPPVTEIINTVCK